MGGITAVEAGGGLTAGVSLTAAGSGAASPAGASTGSGAGGCRAQALSRRAAKATRACFTGYLI